MILELADSSRKLQCQVCCVKWFLIVIDYVANQTYRDDIIFVAAKKCSLCY
jgi:hypothetical protein